MATITSPASPSAFSTESQTLTELHPLNVLPQDQYQTYINILFEYLIGIPTCSTTDAQTKFQEFMSTNGLKKGYESLFFNLLHHCILAIKHNRKGDYIESTTTANNLQAEYVAYLKQSYNRHLNVITTLFDENIFKLSKLLDIEWRFGVTTSNSSLNNVGSCFLQLKLSTLQNGEKSNVIVELTLQQFYAFLAGLQKASGDIGQA